MKLPNWERGVIPEAKITEYLLSFSHPDGRSKAEFFTQFGFAVSSWRILAEALLHHAAEHEVARIETSPFGTRYVIEGIIHSPDGRTPLVRSVWFVESGETIPRFATAYPLKRKAR